MLPNHSARVDNCNVPSLEVHESVTDFDDSFDIRAYLYVILKHKWLVLAVVLISFLGTLAVNLRITPLYKATGRVEISPVPAKITKFDEMLGPQRDTREIMLTHVTLFESETLAKRVIKRLNLETNPLFNPSVDPKTKQSSPSQSVPYDWIGTVVSVIDQLIPWTSRESEASPNAEAALQQNIAAQIIHSLKVQPRRDTTVISIDFSSPDPVLASDIVNAIIEESKLWQVDKKIDSAVIAKQHLEKQLVSARNQFEKAEGDLNAFAQRAGIVSLNSNLNLVYSQLEDINKALSAVHTERISKEVLYQSAQAEGIHLFPLVVDSPMMQKLRSDYIALSAEYSDGNETFGDAYPRLKNLKAKMTDVAKQIQNEEDRIYAAIKNDYLTTLKREKSLTHEAEEKKALAMKLNDRATQYKVLEREVETSKSIHQSLLERSKEIDATLGIELTNIQVVDYATPPLAPFQPNIPRNLFLSIICGLVCGIGTAFLLENLVDNTIKRIDEVCECFHIPVLGVLPLAKADDELNGIAKLVLSKPKAGFSEAIMSAKLSIQLSSTPEEPKKSLVITSTNNGEGKTTIAANLAQAFAISEEKVLIIDADLRKPRLHAVFGTGENGACPGKGLSQYLSGTCEMEEIIRDTELPNLHFISAGPRPSNPADLLASSKMKLLIETLEERFDRIIIDAPPAAGYGDVLGLGNYSSGVLFVSTLGQTHRESLRILQKRLYTVRGRIIGCIINKLNVSSNYCGFYYKYFSDCGCQMHEEDAGSIHQGEGMQGHDGHSHHQKIVSGLHKPDKPELPKDTH